MKTNYVVHNNQTTKPETIAEIQANCFKIQVVGIVKAVCTVFLIYLKYSKTDIKSISLILLFSLKVLVRHKSVLVNM